MSNRKKKYTVFGVIGVLLVLGIGGIAGYKFVSSTESSQISAEPISEIPETEESTESADTEVPAEEETNVDNTTTQEVRQSDSENYNKNKRNSDVENSMRDINDLLMEEDD